MKGSAAGLPEAIWHKLRSHGDVVQHGVISFFGFSGRDVSDRLEQPPVVEPVDPFERGIFDSFKGSPRTSPVDHLRLVKDRKSVVSGKSVSVRVDLGGGRIIKKKQYKT